MVSDFRQSLTVKDLHQSITTDVHTYNLLVFPIAFEPVVVKSTLQLHIDGLISNLLWQIYAKCHSSNTCGSECIKLKSKTRLVLLPPMAEFEFFLLAIMLVRK